ncbi:recombinase family protein, partial [Arthrobacter sulfonylureivorans]|uniref:recombinase family protein n=1 Tax=Arthrobacter sulfonylureivorans TaxID=2486855 RepID=UPI0039E61FE9
AAAEREGWELDMRHEFGRSAATISKRPVMLEILDDLAAGAYGGIVVSKLDRLSRSMEDGTRMLALAQRQGWRIICLDLGVDTGTVMGAAMFNMALNFAEVERKFIGQRTSEALNKLKRVKHVGRPRALDPAVTERIKELRGRGLYYKEIARVLNAEQVPTAERRGPWTIAMVQHHLGTLTAKGEYLGA